MTRPLSVLIIYSTVMAMTIFFFFYILKIIVRSNIDSLMRLLLYGFTSFNLLPRSLELDANFFFLPNFTVVSKD